MPAKSGVCENCNRWRQRLQRDHIIPKHLGGSNLPDNIQFLCANCHEDKSIAEQKALMKRLRADPGYVERHRQGQLRRYAKRGAKKQHGKRLKEHWDADAERRSKSLGEAMALRWEDPAYRKSMVKKLKASHARRRAAKKILELTLRAKRKVAREELLRS